MKKGVILKRVIAGFFCAVSISSFAAAVYFTLTHASLIAFPSIAVFVLTLLLDTMLLKATLGENAGKRLTRMAVYIVFFAYILLFAYILFLSRSITPMSGEELAQFNAEEAVKNDTLNLIPLKTFRRYYDVLSRGVIPLTAAANLVGNLILFMPLGILLPLLSRWTAKPYIAIPLLILLPVLCEGTQLVLRCGVADVDDAILNMAGGLIAYGLMWLPFIRKPLQRGNWWPIDPLKGTKKKV